MDIIERAQLIATTAHAAINQRRKYTDDPYIVHPQAVAELVMDFGGRDKMIAAAWLHDVAEDTAITVDWLCQQMGDDVAKLVDEVTDKSTPADGNRRARKRIDLEALAKASPEAQTIKLADLIDNTRTIIAYDPGFARTHLREKQALLRVLTKGNYALYREAYRSLHWSFDKLGMEA